MSGSGGHTGSMKFVTRAALALAALGVIASVMGCSSGAVRDGEVPR